MLTDRPVRLLLAAAVALAVSGMTSVAMAQTPPPPPPPPPPQQPMTPPPPQQPMTPPPPQPMQPSQSQAGQPSTRFYPGTETTAQYALKGGGTLTVHAGMPNHVKEYGPPPPFSTLDTNHNGRIDEQEAAAYPPLDSGFLFVSGGAKTISKSQYQKWVRTQFPH